MREYHLYVEGMLNRVYKSYKAACIAREAYENEGWNTKLIRWEYTFVGDMGVEV